MGSRGHARGGRLLGRRAPDTAEAAAALGDALSRLGSSLPAYVGAQRRRAGIAASDSPAAERGRAGVDQARTMGQQTLATAGKWGRRLFTLALVGAVAVIARQVRSQPVPPEAEYQ